jgi:uridine kinase
LGKTIVAGGTHLMTQQRYVVAISGPAGAGKSTLVRSVADSLGDATTLFYDDYSDIARWHPNVLDWIAEGADPDAWVHMPQFTADLEMLRNGQQVRNPRTGESIPSARYIVMEEPWGRERKAVAGLIDLVAQINIPLDISLCRRLMRDKDKYDVLTFVAVYEQYDLHGFYTRQLNVADSADVVLNGMRSVEELTSEIVSAVRTRFGAQMSC